MERGSASTRPILTKSGPFCNMVFRILTKGVMNKKHINGKRKSKKRKTNPYIDFLVSLAKRNESTNISPDYIKVLCS